MTRICLALLAATFAITSVRAAEGPPYAKAVTDSASIAAHTRRFAGELHKFGFTGRIEYCHDMMQLAVGVRGGNFSYGAICRVSLPSRSYVLMLCDDDMVGYFAFSTVFAETQEAVLSFVRAQCFGS